jgi:hypothetical protein
MQTKTLVFRLETAFRLSIEVTWYGIGRVSYLGRPERQTAHAKRSADRRYVRCSSWFSSLTLYRAHASWAYSMRLRSRARLDRLRHCARTQTALHCAFGVRSVACRMPAANRTTTLHVELSRARRFRAVQPSRARATELRLLSRPRLEANRWHRCSRATRHSPRTPQVRTRSSGSARRIRGRAAGTIARTSGT